MLSNNYFFIICQNNVKTIKIRSGIDDNFAKHSRSNHLATIRARIVIQDCILLKRPAPGECRCELDRRQAGCAPVIHRRSREAGGRQRAAGAGDVRRATGVFPRTSARCRSMVRPPRGRARRRAAQRGRGARGKSNEATPHAGPTRVATRPPCRPRRASLPRAPQVNVPTYTLIF